MERRLQPFLLRLVSSPRALRRGLVIALDMSVCFVAVWVAYWLRLGEWDLLTRPVLIFAAIALPTWALVSASTRTYRTVTRFSGRHTIFGLMRSCVIMSVTLAVVLLIARIHNVPRTLSVIHPLVFFLGLVGERLLIGQLIAEALRDGHRATHKRILIFGAGASGQQLAASMDREPDLKVVGYIDHNVALRDNVLDGKPIWHVSDLELVLAIERI